MGFFFCPGVPHEYYSTKEPWEIYWIIFDGFSLPGLLEPLGLGEWNILTISNFHSLHMLLQDISICLASESPDKAIESSALLYQFLIKLKNFTLSENRDKNEKYKQLAPVISYMENNYSRYTSVKEMAAIIGVTPYHLCRLFKQTFHTSPFKYLTRLRIQKAKELLVGAPEMTIKTISRKVGYHDTSYFCSIFKANEGITPTEFKKMHGTV
jgi:AraC-like DNA-binding protein